MTDQPEQRQETAIEPAGEPTPWDALKLSHKRFVAEYLQNGHNAYRAAIKAGYTKESAHNAKNQLLDRSDIQACINWFLEKEGMTPAHIKSLFADVVHNADIRNFIDVVDRIDPVTKEPYKDFRISILDDNGEIKPGTHLIQQLSVDKEGRTTLKMYSRLEALDKLAKALQMYTDGGASVTNIGIGITPDMLTSAINDVQAFEAHMQAQLLPPTQPPQEEQE